MICPSGKASYLTKDQAQRARNRKMQEGWDPSVRAYRCDRWGDYHLGHRPSARGLEMRRERWAKSI